MEVTLDIGGMRYTLRAVQRSVGTVGVAVISSPSNCPIDDDNNKLETF